MLLEIEFIIQRTIIEDLGNSTLHCYLVYISLKQRERVNKWSNYNLVNSWRMEVPLLSFANSSVESILRWPVPWWPAAGCSYYVRITGRARSIALSEH